MIDAMLETPPRGAAAPATRPLRLGFAGVGWIGRNRLDAAVGTGRVEVAALVEPQAAVAAEVLSRHPACVVAGGFAEMLDHALDGVVIATPSAQHAEQAMAALAAGIPVFCQKPLGRNAAETLTVLAAARRADRLLGVDLSYRHTRGMEAIRRLVAAGELGEIIAVEAVFHNAYGPDKDWFYSKRQAGGGCLLDLGIHLVDLVLWCLGNPVVREARGARHEAWRGVAGDRVEDHATGFLVMEHGTQMQLSCSWGGHAGVDAEIRVQFFGSRGSACFRNANGSFYHFTAERCHGHQTRELLAGPPDEWGGRAMVDWVGRLEDSASFDPAIMHLVQVATTLDRLYLNTP